MNSVSRKSRIYPIIGALLVIILSFSVLYLGDNVGLSDNGDFRRVLLGNNLKYADDTDHYYLFKEDYKMTVSGSTFSEKVKSVCETNKENEIYSSPHFMVIKLSKVLNLVSNTVFHRDETSYDIFYLAAIYIFLLALAAWGIFTFFADFKRSQRIAVLILFLVMFCDSGYLLYFNSFYGEPLQYVSLMMLISAGLMIYKRPSVPKVVYFYAVLYMFAGSKLVNIPFSIIVSLLAAVIMILRKDRFFKAAVVISAVVSVGFMINLYVSIPDWMQNDTTYQSVFFGVIKESETPEKDLEELGTSPDYAGLMNTHAYMDGSDYPLDINSESFKEKFYDKVSKTDILFFYIRHPGRLFKELNTAIENSAYIRPPGLGNSKTEIMGTTERWSAWSNIRIAMKFLYSPLVIYIIFAALSVYIILVDIFLIRRRKLEIPNRLYMLCGANVLILGLWINMVLPIIGNGEADLAKHMCLFTTCNDILFAVLLIGMFNMPRGRIIACSAAVAAVVMVFYVSPPKQVVSFGTYNGNPIKWEVLSQENDNSVILITKKCINEMSFDDSSNNWEKSDLRAWLNGEFLKEFTDAEKNKIEPVVNEVLLSYDDRNLAVSGDHAHYWNFTKKTVNDLSETAYRCYVEDKVFIPTPGMLSETDSNGSYWVLCPYGSNSYMERYMKSNGFILHTNVKNKKGVRAVLKCRLTE